MHIFLKRFFCFLIPTITVVNLFFRMPVFSLGHMILYCPTIFDTGFTEILGLKQLCSKGFRALKYKFMLQNLGA